MAKNEPKGKTKSMRTIKIGLFLSIPFLLILIVYLGITLYFTEHFYSGSFINGIDYTGKTVEEVEAVLTEDIHSYSLDIWTRGEKKEQITAQDIQLTYISDGKIEELKQKQNPFAWPIAYFKEETYEMSATTTYNQSFLKKAIEALDCYQGKNIIKPKNASYEYRDGTYHIRDEIQGNKLKDEEFYNLVRQAVDSGNTEIFLEEYDIYEKPVITKKNKNLIKLVNTLNKYVGITITYDFADRQEVLDGSTIKQWLKIKKKKNASYDVFLDEIKVREYIDHLSRTYNTFGQTRQFKSWDGSEVTVKGGDYGWRISRSVETEALIEVIKEGKSVTREPIYLQSAYNRNQYDIGDTYVEINLDAQHMWFFKDGKCLVDTAIVTGNISKNYGTPDGVYQITYKERNATLKGENYRTPVNYWLPFNMNIGIHDATWRKDFGKDIYKKSGSHGCINTPYENAKIIYENIEAGVPVVCYNKTLSKEVLDELQNKKK